MEKKDHSEIIVGNVCFIRDKKNNKVLLLKRSKGSMQNMFAGVGGKTNFKESSYESCSREAKEETGLNISEIKLRGVIKTILEGTKSYWILFVYTADEFNGELISCNEGELSWVDVDKIYSYKLIGFIKKLMPYILSDNIFFEGLIIHDINGNIISDDIIIV